MSETDIALIKKDVDCLQRFKDDIGKRFEDRHPARETLTLIGQIKSDMAVNKQILEDMIKSNEEAHKLILHEVKDIKVALRGYVEDAKETYATKESSWSEKILVWVGMVVGGIILSAIIYQIIKK